ncbi:MAG: hypothetical protein ACP5US_06655 [Candidatus Kryptoniota bacterium]
MKLRDALVLSTFLVVNAAANAQVIDFRQLELSLPQDSVIDGYRRTKAGGETAAMMGFSTSWAQVGYKADAESSSSYISFRVSDMIHVSSFFILAMTGNVDKETKTGYERTVDYRGLKILEAYDSLSKSAKLEMPVAGRFLVQVAGNNISSIKTLYHFLELSDIARLERVVSNSDQNRTK